VRLLLQQPPSAHLVQSQSLEALQLLAIQC